MRPSIWRGNRGRGRDRDRGRGRDSGRGAAKRDWGTFLDEPEEDEEGVNNISRTLSCHTIGDWNPAEYFLLI